MISIIFPTLNEEGVIGQTLSMFKSRLTLPHELIVSDGKSTDKTTEIAKQYTDKVVVHGGEHRQTIAGGRNAGADAAQGEFLVFMDADSRIEDPNHFFTVALKCFEDNKKLVGLTVRVKVYPKDQTWADNLIFGVQNKITRFTNNVLHVGQSTGEFQMIRASAFKTLGGYREDLVAGEDHNMFMRLSKIGRTRFEPSIKIEHSGRRAHKTGWPRLLWKWFINGVWIMFFDKAQSKEWTVIR